MDGVSTTERGRGDFRQAEVPDLALSADVLASVIEVSNTNVQTMTFSNSTYLFN